MNVFGEPVDGVSVVLNLLALLDFRFGSFNPPGAHEQPLDEDLPLCPLQ
ncbi:MAG TPA: hypothetical protein VMQ86_20255 [Bryobacteraceae bacterium]|nr:hypothetical protein [Bryobacteraceae bacterium]